MSRSMNAAGASDVVSSPGIEPAATSDLRPGPGPPEASGQWPGAELISAVVLTRDEARHVMPCLEALSWAAERVVVDCGSTDGTPRLAQQAGARVVTRSWDNYAAQRNFALAQAACPWVFFVDADERVPPELAREAAARVAAAERALRAGASGAPVGFWVPRQNLILGRWVRCAGWDPDYQLRLFRRDRGRYDPARPVHELVLLDGPSERLVHRLVHHNYTTWRQFWTKQRRYARLEAAALYARGVRPKPQNFVLQPLREFRRRFFTLRGYRAGLLGLALSLALAAANFVTYVDLLCFWLRAARARATEPGS